MPSMYGLLIDIRLCCKGRRGHYRFLPVSSTADVHPFLRNAGASCLPLHRGSLLSGRITSEGSFAQFACSVLFQMFINRFLRGFIGEVYCQYRVANILGVTVELREILPTSSIMVSSVTFPAFPYYWYSAFHIAQGFVLHRWYHSVFSFHQKRWFVPSLVMRTI